MSKLLIDTHVLIWLILGENTLSSKKKQLLITAAKNEALFFSAISIWEIAMLAKAQRIILHQPISLWITEILATPGLQLIQLTPQIMCESVELPGDFHKDPADRMIVATARIENATLVTRDARILDYATAGYLSAIEA
ncbi:MAG: type II toxin-antitoxin system VapC family toxin [Gammaproteobacteria bacterium]